MPALVGTTLTMLLCLVFLVLCVNSFIQARKRRQAGQAQISPEQRRRAFPVPRQMWRKAWNNVCSVPTGTRWAMWHAGPFCPQTPENTGISCVPRRGKKCHAGLARRLVVWMSAYGRPMFRAEHCRSTRGRHPKGGTAKGGDQPCF